MSSPSNAAPRDPSATTAPVTHQPAPAAGAPWYQAVGKEKQGPFSLEELAQKKRSGQLGPADMLWQQGMSRWVPARSIPGLFPPATVAALSLDLPTLAPLAQPLVPPASAVVVPGYEVLGELGRGGMGVVYQARQVKLNRLVALKMVLSGAHAGRDELARFSREAEALARLQHPNIVQIYEVGEHEGRPFFSLELLEGGSLQKKLQGKPLPPREAAALLEVLARAVAAAHHKGVLHRDLKPANVLLTADGTPKVADFGLAKKLEEAEGQTASGAVLGTPSYMPPEQALGQQSKIGVGSDVYSLGAMLYELLTGRPPFLADTPLNTILQVVAEEPAAPCRLNSKVPRDLETITLKCLQKDLQQRYASAEALAEDLRCFQAGETITARPVGRLGRFIKWVKRRPAAAALCGVALALLLVGGATWLGRARAQAEQRARATAALEQALEQAERVRGKGGDGVPADLAAWSGVRAAARRAETLLEDGGTAKDLRRMRDLLDELDGLDRDRLMVGRLEEIRLRQTEVKDERFDIQAADPEYAAAFRDYGVDPDALPAEEAGRLLGARSIKEQLAAALDHWASVRQARRKSDPAAWKRLLEAARLADPDPARNQFRDAMLRGDVKALRAMADEDRAVRLPAGTVVLLGDALARARDLPAAVRFLQWAQQRRPADFWINHQLAWRLDRMKPPRREEALRYYTAALALRPLSPGIHVNRGNALRAVGDLDGADAAFREAVRLKKDYAGAHYNLGNLLDARGDLAGAIACYRDAVRHKPAYASAHTQLANALFRKGDVAESVACSHKAILLNPDSARAHAGLGVALNAWGDSVGALDAFRTAAHLEPDSAMAHNNLAGAFRVRGDGEGAAAECRKALRLDPDYAEAHFNLGMALLEQGRFAEALPELTKADQLGAGKPGWRFPAAQRARWTKTLIAMDARLPAILNGTARPVNSAERINFAALCMYKGLFGTAARFYQKGFIALPTAADNLGGGRRYDAACCAVRAASGQGKDGDAVSEAERARWRKQALVWLSADLILWEKRLDADTPKARAAVRRTLMNWQTFPALDSIREAAALARLSVEEQTACKKFWTDVAAVLGKVAIKP